MAISQRLLVSAADTAPCISPNGLQFPLRPITIELSLSEPGYDAEHIMEVAFYDGCRKKRSGTAVHSEMAK